MNLRFKQLSLSKVIYASHAECMRIVKFLYQQIGMPQNTDMHNDTSHYSVFTMGLYYISCSAGHLYRVCTIILYLILGTVY